MESRKSVKSFDIKKNEFYSKSTLKINSELMTYDNWTEVEINARQLKLADYAVNIWNVEF